MQYPEFIHEAKARLDVETEQEVLTIARAFLHTLTEHQAGNAADKLGAQLPAPLLEIIHEIPPAERDQGERFKLTEFYERVGQRAGTDAETGQRYSQQLMHLLGEMVTAGEIHKLRVTLSEDYTPLFKGVAGLNEAG